MSLPTIFKLMYSLKRVSKCMKVGIHTNLEMSNNNSSQSISTLIHPQSYHLSVIPPAMEIR